MDLIRDIHAATYADIVSGNFHPVVLVMLDWPGGPVRVHSGDGMLTWGGHEWLGVNRFGGMTFPSEMLGPAMTEGRLTLGGDPARIEEIVSDAAEAAGREVRAWLGTVTQRSGAVLIGEPFDLWQGVIGQIGDTEEWNEDQALAVVEVEITSGVSQRSRGSVHHTYEDQRRTDPTDTAGRWVVAALASAKAQLPKW